MHACWMAVLIQALLFTSSQEWEDIVDRIKSNPAGVCVVLEDSKSRLALELARDTELLLFVQIEDAREVEEARRAVEAAGFYGKRIYVERGDLARIHLADNLADHLVAMGDGGGVSEAEALRVLRPGGKAYLKGKTLTKAPPEGVDDWSHPYHGPDNNPLSEDRIAKAPYLTQFLADPRYAPVPQAAVASAGRLFKAFGHVAFKEREEPWLNQLVAFNGYNGAILWKRDLVPGIMVHRNTLIATPEVLYLGDDTSCKVIDAATGRIMKEIKPPLEIAGGTFWKWMALEDGMLYALIGKQEYKDPVERHKMEFHGWPWNDISVGFNLPKNPWGYGRNLLAIDPATEKVLWFHREADPIDSRALCMKGGRIFLFRHGAYLACLDPKTGAECWRITAREATTPDQESAPSTLPLPIESKDRETEKATQVHIGETRAYTKENAPPLFEALGDSINRQGWETNWRTTCFLKCSDRALYFSGPQVGKLLALSAEDGRVLWEDPYDNFQSILRPDGLYCISGPFDVKASKSFDPLTGKVLAKMDIGRRACSRPTGTMDAIFFRARGGSVRPDMNSKEPQWISPMRAQCHDGVTISNGFLYWWPSVCDCNLSIYGVTCLGPAGDFDFYGEAISSERLEGGGDTPIEEPLIESIADWPTFRGTNARTAASGAPLSGEIRLLSGFVPPSPQVPTPPTAAGGLLFFSGSDGIVHALDAASGKTTWKAYTGGRVRIPPTIHEGRALVGSNDGFVYAFDAKEGRLLWRFLAAPEERKIPVYGELCSTWPVASGVLAEDGIAYLAAGIVNYDGTYLYALDVETGGIVWQNSTSGHLDREARTGVSVQGHLLLQGDRLYLAGGTAVSPAIYDKKNGTCLNSAEQLKECEARCSRGWELYLVGDKVVACGRPYYAHPDYRVFDDDVSRKLLVAPVADRDVILVNNHKLFCFPRIDRDKLNACVADRAGQSWFSYNWGDFKIPGLDPCWSRNCRGTVAIAVCPNAVVLAREKEGFALDLVSGKILWVMPLASPPVSWGLCVDRDGRVIVTLEDGRVLCYGGWHTTVGTVSRT